MYNLLIMVLILRIFSLFLFVKLWFIKRIIICIVLFLVLFLKVFVCLRSDVNLLNDINRLLLGG